MKIDDILKMAVELKASDLHISVKLKPTARVYGRLVPLEIKEITKLEAENFVKEILSRGDLDKLDFSGEIDTSYKDSKGMRYRVNIFRQRGLYSIAFRIIKVDIPNMDSLKIPSIVKDICKKQRGLIIVSGISGSGKSTTLASILDDINNTTGSHVITIEDPIEYIHENKKSIFNQREVGKDTKSFFTALKSSLRQDPDVIMIGEIRDLETISTAITAAETGHMVLATLHTRGCVNTLDRMIDVFGEETQKQIRIQLASVLELVIYQQLVPQKSDDSLVGAFEVMVPTNAIKNLIREGKNYQIQSLIQMGKDTGMQTMDDSLLDMYKEGVISKETLLEYGGDSICIKKEIEK